MVLLTHCNLYHLGVEVIGQTHNGRWDHVFYTALVQQSSIIEEKQTLHAYCFRGLTPGLHYHCTKCYINYH